MAYLDMRLFCRFYERKGGWKAILNSLRGEGWTVGENALRKRDLELELVAESEDGTEVALSLRATKGCVDPDDLRDLLRSILSFCWYVDVYSCFREVERDIFPETFELDTGRNVVKRVRIGGVDVVLESYPSLGKITASYRVSARNVDSVKRVHSKLLESVMAVGVVR